MKIILDTDKKTITVPYNYQDKYNLEASFRRDGSSRFHRDARWGNFWSIGANWMISQEAFMQSVGWVNSLKLRADFGQVGNDSGSGYYGYQALYTSGQNANKEAYWLSQLENQQLMWETGQSWGVGIESRLFNRLNFNIEYFDRQNKDLLFDVILPITAGATSTGGTNPSITKNIGTMSNRGLEIEADIDIIRNRDWRVNFNANATFLKNKIVSLPEDDRENGIIDGTKRYVEGGDRYAYWLYQFAGVDQMTGLSGRGWQLPFPDGGQELHPHQWRALCLEPRFLRQEGLVRNRYSYGIRKLRPECGLQGFHPLLSLYLCIGCQGIRRHLCRQDGRKRQSQQRPRGQPQGLDRCSCRNDRNQS